MKPKFKSGQTVVFRDRETTLLGDADSRGLFPIRPVGNRNIIFVRPTELEMPMPDDEAA